MVEEKRNRFPAILESLDVCDEPASFQGEDKFFRRAFIPALKDFFPGKAVKGDVELYRVEVFGIKLKPPFLRKIRRIEGPVPPMGIVVTARPDVNQLFDCGLRTADCGIGRHHLNV